MYCPKCSQPHASDETQFCSRCGLPLNNLKQMIADDGKTQGRASEEGKDKLSPYQKGVRQGVALMLLSIILIPVYILLAPLFPANDHLVESSVSDTPFEKISQAVLLLLFMSGLARLLYARFFQQNTKLEERESQVAQLSSSSSNYALPPAQGIPVSGFGTWRASTGELAQSPKVVEHTTNSLDEE